jgi:CheY-like chemotaxis protein
MSEQQIKPTILLLDDEKSVLFALKLLLEALKFGVIDFSVPHEAVEFLRTLDSSSADGRPDLFICDLKMPKMNGLEVLEASRRLAPALPFVLMSAHANQDEVDKAISLGASSFLAKPFSPAQLEELVRSLPLANKRVGGV